MSSGNNRTKFEEAREAHAALRDIFIRHSGAGACYRTLRRVLALCEAASSAVDEGYCREKIRVVAEYAAELLAHSEHAKWGRDSARGAEFLRQQVLNALELYASRLYSLEALRRVEGNARWTTRSNPASA